MWAQRRNGFSKSNLCFTEPFLTSVVLEFQQAPTFLAVATRISAAVFGSWVPLPCTSSQTSIPFDCPYSPSFARTALIFLIVIAYGTPSGRPFGPDFYSDGTRYHAILLIITPKL